MHRERREKSEMAIEVRERGYI